MKGGAHLKFYFLQVTLIWRVRHYFEKIRYFDFLKASRVLSLIIQLLIQTFLHRRYFFVFSVLKILYDLNVYYNFFKYIILTQLRLEEVTVRERFSGFSETLSQIVDPNFQDQTLRHFSYQIFKRFLKYWIISIRFAIFKSSGYVTFELLGSI